MILTSLSKFRDFGLLLLRLGIGGLMIWHGWPLLIGGSHKWLTLGASMKSMGITFSPVFWGFMAAFSQVIGGGLFALGLFLRPATFLLAVTMGVAIFTHVHAGEPLTKWSEAAELAIIYISFFFIGAGRYSFDGD